MAASQQSLPLWPGPLLRRAGLGSCSPQARPTPAWCWTRAGCRARAPVGRVGERRAASSARAPKEARRAHTFLTGFQSGQKPASRRPSPEEKEKSAFWWARSPSTARAPRAPLSLEGVQEGAGPCRHAPSRGQRRASGPVLRSPGRWGGRGSACRAPRRRRTPAPPARPGLGRRLHDPPPPSPNERLPLKIGAVGEGTVLPSARAGPPLLTPQAAAVAAAVARPGPWSAGPDPAPQRLSLPPSVSDPSRSVCFCFVLPSNTGATGRRLLANPRRSSGQS